MRTVNLVYDAVSNSLTADDTDAGSTVDSGVTALHVDRTDDGCTSDLVFGVMLRSGGRLQGYPFSRLDADGNAVLYSDVLSACTGGTLPVSLRMTYGDGTVKSSKTCILHVTAIPDPSVLTAPAYKDVIMTRNTSWEWAEEWSYEKGALVTYRGVLWIANRPSKGEKPGETDAWQNVSTGQTPIETFDVFLPSSGWTEESGDLTYNVEHVGFRERFYTVVHWADEDYMPCWISDIQLKTVSDGVGTFRCSEPPSRSVTLHIETYETKEI